jgi:hypothetical protein
MSGTSSLLSDEYALAWPKLLMAGMPSICVGIRDHGLVEGVAMRRCVGVDLYILSLVRRSPTERLAWTLSRRGKRFLLSCHNLLAGARESETETRKKNIDTAHNVLSKRKQKAHNIDRSYAYYFFLSSVEKISLYMFLRSCCNIFRDMSSISTPQRCKVAERKKKLKGPTHR